MRGLRSRSSGVVWDRPARAWVFYDLANVLFAINIVSLYFPLWVIDDAGGNDTNYALATGAAMALVFVLAPILGTLSDRMSRRLPVLIALTVGCCATTVLLGTWGLFVSLALFVVANTMFQLSLLVYDSLLPVVSTPETRGRMSGYASAAGFAGSMLGIGIGMTVLAFDDTAKPTIFRLTGLFFLLGAIPCFLWVKEPRRAQAGRIDRAAFQETFRDLRATARDARGEPGVVRFLIGRVFYTDAASALLIFMSIYATEEIGFSEFQTQLVLLAGILAGPIGSLGSGSAVDRIGPRKTLNFMLLVWVFAFAASALVPLLGLPSWLFWIVAPLVGIGLGGTGTTERAYYLRLVPPDQLGRYLGLYAMLGRFASIISPLLWVLVADLLGLGRPAAVLSLLMMVLIARRILAPINDAPRPWTVPHAAAAGE